MCECGHDKWSHAISQKGVVGSCLKEIIKGWKYCDCKEFRPTPDAPDLRHVCADCGKDLQEVRPGEFQCDCGASR